MLINNNPAKVSQYSDRQSFDRYLVKSSNAEICEKNNEIENWLSALSNLNKVLISKSSANNSLKNRQVSFKGFRFFELVDSSMNGVITPLSVNDTCFFRDSEGLEFLKAYLNENFKNGTTIANFGCSDGEETYSLAMLLNDINTDKKYKITGYDLSKKVINKAEKGVFSICRQPPTIKVKDDFLIKDDFELSEPEQKEYKDLFHQYFTEVEKPDNFLGNEEIYANDCKNLRDENFLEKFYQVKNKNFDDVIDFKTGNICDIGNKNLGLEEKPGCIMFRNGWYHLTGNGSVMSQVSMNNVEDLIPKIRDSLADNGVLVLGTFWADHMFSDQGKLPVIEKIKDGLEEKKVIKSSPFHNILRKNGFVPIFYEKCQTYPCDVSVPTVWKKV